MIGDKASDVVFSLKFRDGIKEAYCKIMTTFEEYFIIHKIQFMTVKFSKCKWFLFLTSDRIKIILDSTSTSKLVI